VLGLIPAAIRWPALALIAGIAIGTTTGATLNGWRWEVKLSKAQSEHAAHASALATAATQASERVRIQERQTAQIVADLDQTHTRALHDAKNEIDTARAAVAAGERRLRINASCPADNPAGLSGAASTSGLDNDASPGLDAVAERHYFDLRERVTLMERQLGACQDYVRGILQ